MDLPATGLLALGLDAGSVSFKYVLADLEGRILADRYERTLGRPVECALRLLGELFERIDPRRLAAVAGTGSAGRLICQLLGVPFVNELICQAVAIKRLAPAVRTLIEMGGQDSKMLFLGAGGPGSGIGEKKNAFSAAPDPRSRTPLDQPIVDFAMNTNCAAGTGSFLDQQASRLNIDIENEFGELALRSVNPPRVAGRCSVFAKSDMIHLQQLATPDYDIVAGLCLGLARNLKSNLSRGHEVVKPIGFAGGVAANKGVVRALESVFDLAAGELVVSDFHATSGAYGAALVRLSQDGLPTPRDRRPDVAIDLGRLKDYLSAERTIGHRLDPLPRPRAAAADNGLAAAPAWGPSGPQGTKIDAYLGLDVGSISTKIAVIDAANRVLGKCYLMTAGRPLEAVRQCLAQVGRQVEPFVTIRGAATTGSGRYLTGDFIGADLVINEITAQAHAAALTDPAVDTIFEIGGQDSKYISLDNGVVVDFEMNHACAAGTGSFLEEQAERLNIRIQEQFARMACASDAPIRLGERCTVFMESDLLSYQQQGAEADDLVAGLSYSIVTNYLNRVVGHRRVGKRIFFQGGTAFNEAVVAAFEKETGKPITVPPHHEVTGAIGAAALARKFMRDNSRGGGPPGSRAGSGFRGFDLSKIDYRVRSFECTACPNQCEINEVTVAGRDPLFYGSRCDRYNVRKRGQRGPAIPDLFAERNRLLHEYAGLGGPTDRAPLNPKSKIQNPKSVGVPLALGHYQLLPFWGTLLGELGLKVVVTPTSNRDIIHSGVEAVAATPCFPVKVTHGHALRLIEQQVDYLWLPSVISMPQEFPEAPRNQLCPYVQTIPYQVAVALEPAKRGVKLLKPVVRFDRLSDVLAGLAPLCAELGVSKGQMRRAVARAAQAQRGFEEACRRRGREILASLDPNRRNVVIVSRPYNGCDAGVSLDLPAKLRRLGVLAIPMDFLDPGDEDLGADRIFSNMYWKYGQRILRTGKVIRANPRLHGVYLSNFACGPDSFIISFFKQVMGPKPCLVLEVDEHSADAGVVTRLEAFLESLSNAETQGRCDGDGYQPLYPANGQVNCDRRTVYVPWMGDGSRAMVSAFRAVGQPSEALPLADQPTLDLGRRYSTGKECLPCIITTGDMVRKCQEPGFAPDRAAFLMPGGSGPCRFGQYNCMHKMVLKELGLGDVPVIAPSQDKSFYKDFRQFGRDPTRLAWNGMAAIDLLLKALLAIRPYEVERGRTLRTYDAWVERVCQALERSVAERGLVAMMIEAASEFAAIPTDRSRPRPRIGIVGEIYVRNHAFSNNRLIEQLESLGAATALASFPEWIYYTNFTRKRSSWRERGWRMWLGNVIKDRVQKSIHHRIGRAFLPLLADAIEPPIRHVLELAAPYIHDSFEGEAVLSVGKIIDFCHSGCDGVVNVMPFTCMPSTIVSSLTKRLTEDLGGVPLLSISYDGQQDPTLQTRLEAFVYQADAFRRRRERTGVGSQAEQTPV